MISGAVIVLITFTILYFAMKATGSGSVCLPGQDYKCPDAANWSSDATVGAASCSSTGQWVTDGKVGPGHCAVTCPAGYTPCWDSVKGAGTCVQGTTCPCSADSDCKNGGTCDPSEQADCKCSGGYTGSRCEIAPGPLVPCNDYTCSSVGGSCVGGTCVCKGAGWNLAAPSGSNLQCSVCKPGWGPPEGSPNACTANHIVTGINLPLTVNDTNCVNTDLHQDDEMTQMCRNEYGQSASYNTHCDGSDNSCQHSCYPKDFGTNNVIVCGLSNGYWSTIPQGSVPAFDQCNGPCDSPHRPTGYVQPV
jgi:hypothetical protein